MDARGSTDVALYFAMLCHKGVNMEQLILFIGLLVVLSVVRK